MRDDHPRRRQAKRVEQKLARAKDSRQGLPVIIVVCEGTETEPNYLRGLCEARRINAANIRIESGGSATDALSLVKKTRALFSKDRDYDRVYVISDDDGQPLEEAKTLAQKSLKTVSGKNINVEVLTSRPVFEYWLLLHFEYSTRPFATAAEVIDVLRRHLTDFNKSDRQIFAHVDAGLGRAMTNVERLKRELAGTGATCPNTDMNLLVAQLLTMARAGGFQ